MKLGKILGTVADVAGAATGNPWIAGAGQLLGAFGGGEGAGKYTPPKTGWQSLAEIFGEDFTNQLVEEAKANHSRPRPAPAFRPFTAQDTGDTSVFRPNAAISLAGWDTNRKMAAANSNPDGVQQNTSADTGNNGDAIMGLLRLQELSGLDNPRLAQSWKQRGAGMSLSDLAQLGNKLKGATAGGGVMSGGYSDAKGNLIDLSRLFRGSA